MEAMRQSWTDVVSTIYPAEWTNASIASKGRSSQGRELRVEVKAQRQELRGEIKGHGEELRREIKGLGKELRDELRSNERSSRSAGLARSR
jgi:hypothetical protein